MTETQTQNLSSGRKGFIFVLLLPILLVLLVIQALTVFGLDELPAGSPAVTASKTASGQGLTPGSSVNYTIVISNTGGTEASGMAMVDTLPAEFSVNSAQVASLVNATGPTVDVVNDVVSWNGTLGADTGRVEILINAVLTDTAVVGNIITNTAQVTGGGPTLNPAAGIEVVDDYEIYMPIVFKPLAVPTLLSIGEPTSNNNFSTYNMLVTWEDLNDSSLTYQLQESTDPSFSNPTVYNAGTATSYSVSHSPTTVYHFYYRVRAIRASANLSSDWSNVLSGYGAYRDDFNDPATGWKLVRQDTDDTKDSLSYFNGQLKLKIGGRWDSAIASPLVPTPDWPDYRIDTRVRLGDGIDNLHSYGIVFGADWDGVTPCPNNDFSSCFNKYYRLNVVWHGADTFLGNLKRVDSHDTSDNSSSTTTIMSTRAIHNVNPDSWNTWVIDVHQDGTIRMFVNGSFVYEGTDSSYVGGGRYFGTFASSDEYSGTAAYYEYFRVEPIP